MIAYPRAGRRRVALLWVGVVLALFPGLTLILAARYGGFGPDGGPVFAVLAVVALVGVVLVVLSLRRPSDLASNRQTGLLLEWLEARPDLLKAAENSGSAEGLRRLVVEGASAAEARRLFAEEDAGSWPDAVHWDELYDALPRRGRQVAR